MIFVPWARQIAANRLGGGRGGGSGGSGFGKGGGLLAAQELKQRRFGGFDHGPVRHGPADRRTVEREGDARPQNG